MSVPLYNEAPPNAVAFVLAWLKPLGPGGSKRWDAGDPLPYRMVNRVTGADDLFTDEPIVSVHTFGSTETQAQREADITHRRMLYLTRFPLTDVVMADGLLANIEYLITHEKAVRVDYADTMVTRMVARYQLGLSFVAV